MYTMEYCVSRKKEILTFCDSIGGPADYSAKWNKPVRERWILYDLTYMWNPMNKIKTDMDTWNRSTALGERELGEGRWGDEQKKHLCVIHTHGNSVAMAGGKGGWGQWKGKRWGEYEGICNSVNSKNKGFF